MTNPPLSEKEVEKIILAEGREDMERENNNIELTEDDVKRAVKKLCSHFSKQIKYPEKKEELSRCVPKNDYNWGYNQAIDDMHKLNGEGGV